MVTAFRSRSLAGARTARSGKFLAEWSGCLTKLSIAGGVADQDDFVDTAHPSIIAMLCKKCV
jgi:hypothetical protein